MAKNRIDLAASRRPYRSGQFAGLLMPVTISKRSVVRASADEVWQRVTTPEGINHELSPFVHMTTPRSMKGRSAADMRPGERLGRSWLLLGQLIPFEYDDIRIAELEPGHRFREASSMLFVRRWEHERTLRPAAGGTEISDKVTFELRRPLDLIPGFPQLVAGLLSHLFSHRHRQLQRWFHRE